MEVLKWAAIERYSLISFSCSHREVPWAQMRLAKDWGCMISGTEYGTYRGPAHSVVRAYTMGSTGLHPLWSSCKNRVMQLQLLALPSNPVEGSVSFWAQNWAPFSLCISMGWNLRSGTPQPENACSVCAVSSVPQPIDKAPATIRRKPTRICSSASIPWCGCPLMEFLCVGIIWASTSGRNSHTFLQRLFVNCWTNVDLVCILECWCTRLFCCLPALYNKKRSSAILVIRRFVNCAQLYSAIVFVCFLLCCCKFRKLLVCRWGISELWVQRLHIRDGRIMFSEISAV